MKAGSAPLGGGELFPGSVLQVTPQVAAAGLSAKALKLAWEPLAVGFCFHPCPPQNIRFVPVPLSRSLIAKEPPPGTEPANTNTLVQVAVVVLVPTSVTVVVTVKNPVDEKV